MKYELSDLIDIPQLQKLLNSFYNLTGITSGVISKDGTILTKTAWRDICTKFHKVNLESSKLCAESDKYILDQYKKENPIISLKCRNGLVHMGIPIIVDNNFLATIFVGQILLENPDLEYFKEQAKKFDYDEKSYIGTLKDIPVVTKEEHEKIIFFLKDFAQMINEMCLRQLKLLETQKKLELSEERYKLAIYGSNNGVWDWCFLDKTFYASDRLLEIVDYTSEEINSLIDSFADFIHPDDRTYYLKKYTEHLNGISSHFNQEVRIKTKLNGYKWVLIRGAAIFNEIGVPIRMAGSLTDLSSKKSAEDLLKKEQHFSKTIIDNANIIICVWNEDGTLVKFNKYGQKICGYYPKDVLDYNWMNTSLKEVGEKVLNYIKKSKIDTIHEENCIICKNGLSLNILWTNQILRNEDGSVKNIISMGLDITERINEEKRLTEFFANISHELRTPLNILFSSLQLIYSYLDKNLFYEGINKIMKNKKSMKQNCYRLLRLVNNLIDITKIDSGYLKLNMKKCNIVNLIEDIALSITPYTESKNLTLLFDTDVEEKIICCDPDNIERIILNLLSNAIKFTKPNDSIFVNVQDKEESIVITIKDTGIGIPENKLNLIFERFKQINKSFTRENEGSGIGLSLVKALVEMHNGSIKVESSYGEGCKFIIELPVNNLNCENCEDDFNIYEKLNSSYTDRVEKINIEFSDIYFI